MARDGKPIISKSYGMANYEMNVPNRRRPYFAQLYHQTITAMAILMLQDKGKLNTMTLSANIWTTVRYVAAGNDPPLLTIRQEY